MWPHPSEIIAVELVQALGGGWNASELPAPSKITTKDAVSQTSSTQ